MNLVETPLLQDMLQRNGRLRYQPLSKLVLNSTPGEFVSQFRWPVLIGKTLFQGTLNKGADTASTMVFQKEGATQEEIRRKELEAAAAAAAEEAEQPSDALAQAIFVLSQQADSQSPTGIVMVGRVEQNDLVMADYSISKVHARIIPRMGRFGALFDCGSTNGTMVKRIKVSERGVALVPGVEITFGRCSFIYAPPPLLYKALRAMAGW